MENMAPLRSSQSHGGSRDLFVRTRSNDSPHSAVNEQIQLARWSKACGIGAKRTNARTIVLNPLSTVVGQMGAATGWRICPQYRIYEG